MSVVKRISGTAYRHPGFGGKKSVFNEEYVTEPLDDEEYPIACVCYPTDFKVFMQSIREEDKHKYVCVNYKEKAQGRKFSDMLFIGTLIRDADIVSDVVRMNLPKGWKEKQHKTDETS